MSGKYDNAFPNAQKVQIFEQNDYRIPPGVYTVFRNSPCIHGEYSRIALKEYSRAKHTNTISNLGNIDPTYYLLGPREFTVITKAKQIDRGIIQVVLDIVCAKLNK